MDLYPGYYFHIFNRSNNNEIVFKEAENFLYFLKKYRHYLDDLITTLAYCLMPTHFHFLVYISSEDVERIQQNIGVLLSSYAKAINKRYKRHGSLFQSHTKAVLIKNEKHLLLAVAYIHQNPVHAGIVKMPEEWTYSSYRDYIGIRNGTLPETKTILERFSSSKEFIEFSSREIPDDDINVISGRNN